MRTALKELGYEKRYTFKAEIERFGQKSAFKGPPIKTVLLRNITYQGTQVADHLWFTFGKNFEKSKAGPGDQIIFDARVTQYEKGYKGRRNDDEIYWYHPIETDYKLSLPTKIKKL